MLRHFLKNKAFAGLMIGLFISALLVGLNFFNIFDSLHAYFADSLYTRHEPSKDIVIIAIDEKSTKREPEGLGRFSNWNRDHFTNLLKILATENAEVISFDLTFNTYTTSIPHSKLLELESEIINKSADEKLKLYEEFVKKYKSSLNNPIDDEFAQQLGLFDNIVLAASFKDNKLQLVKPLPKFLSKSTLGIINAEIDDKSILRKTTPTYHLQSENRTYDNFSIATVKKYLGKNELNLSLQDDKLLVNFFGDPFSYKMISFVDVLNKNFKGNLFKDKIVLIGATSKELHDEYYTPRSNISPMPGVEFRANEIQTILEGKFLLNQSKLSQILTIFAIVMALTIALSYLGIIFAIFLTMAAIVLYLGAAHFFYYRGLILNMVYPFLAIVLAYLGSWVYKYFIADKGKREIKSAFGHYLSPELVDQIAKNPEIVKLGGEKRPITVFFTDIKDSTAYSEKTPITTWVSQINEYFTVMEYIIKSYGGTLDKYEGDAIMGFFNAPISQQDHVLRAYLTALAMQKALLKLHKKWQKEGKPLIKFRLGINTGEALVGNFGSSTRFDYTAMGDTVNTASRLESSANKTYGTEMIVAGFAGQIQQQELDKVVLRELDTVYLPGKKEPVNLFELICLKQEISETLQKNLETYAVGLAAYRAKDWKKAIEAFETLTREQSTNSAREQSTNSAAEATQAENQSVESIDLPSKIMLTRCQLLLKGEKIPELDENMIFRIINK